MPQIKRKQTNQVGFHFGKEEKVTMAEIWGIWRLSDLENYALGQNLLHEIWSLL